MSLQKILDEWAQKLSDKAAEKATPFQESIDAFKVVSAYYAAQQKGRKKPDEDESGDDGFTFADGAGNGGSAESPQSRVPARRAS